MIRLVRPGVLGASGFLWGFSIFCSIPPFGAELPVRGSVPAMPIASRQALAARFRSLPCSEVLFYYRSLPCSEVFFYYRGRKAAVTTGIGHSGTDIPYAVQGVAMSDHNGHKNPCCFPEMWYFLGKKNDWMALLDVSICWHIVRMVMCIS